MSPVRRRTISVLSLGAVAVGVVLILWPRVQESLALRRLESDHAETRHAAARWLGGHKSKRAIRPLLDLAADDSRDPHSSLPDDHYARVALRAIGPDSLRVFLQTCRSNPYSGARSLEDLPKPFVDFYVVGWILVDDLGRESIPVLYESLSYDSGCVRYFALTALQSFRDERFDFDAMVALIAPILHDDRWNGLQESAVRMLCRMGEHAGSDQHQDRILKLITKLLETRDPFLRNAVVECLGTFGRRAESVVPFVVNWALETRESQPGFYETAFECLARIGIPALDYVRRRSETSAGESRVEDLYLALEDAVSRR